MGEASRLPMRGRPEDGRIPSIGAPSWMMRTDAVGRWLGTLFCGCGVLTLASLALPRHFVDSPAFVVVVAFAALAIGTMLLRGALKDGPPSSFMLMIAGANVLVSFGAYVSGNPLSGVELFYLWVTPYAYVLFSPVQAAMQTGIVALCWGLVLVTVDQQHPSAGSANRLVANWVFTVVTVGGVGILVRVLSSSLRDVDRRFHRAFTDSGIGAAFLTTDLRWLEVNGAFCRILGYRSEELVGRPLSEIVDGVLSGGPPVVPTPERQVVDEELRYRRCDGSTVWLLVTSSLVVPEAGAPYVFAQYRDVSDSRHVEEELGYQAAHDPLTGLANRARLMQKLEAALEVRARKGTGVGVVLLDLDQFKVINDSLGHHIGDQVLTAMSLLLEASCEPGDTLARLGGDEFVVLCEGLSGASEALDRATRISQALSQTIELPTGHYSATASIGVAVATEPGDDGYSLLREADAAMYRAKAAGRGRIELFNVAMREDADRRNRLARDLKGAIADGQLLLEYQPTVELETGYPILMEALVRWNHPERGRLSPFQFVPMADDAGLFAELGEWVLETACEEFSAWRRDDPSAMVRVSVNVSLAQLAMPRFSQRIIDLLIRRSISPSRLCLEVAESPLLDNSLVLVTLETLRTWGIEIVLDNFDTRHSCLDHLERLPIGMVKADRSVTARLAERPRQEAVIGSILAMADALGLSFVAGAVETEAQLEQLKAVGCRLVQGNAVAPPMAASEVPSYLRRVMAPSARGDQTRRDQTRRE
jgi:diguanylate cyclase (GGDEF)-like protein/PAS domain S-box-containing protein